MKKNIVFILIVLSIVSCKTKSDSQTSNNTKAEIIQAEKVKLIEVSRPVKNQMHAIGDDIQLILNRLGDQSLDSVNVFLDNQLVETQSSFIAESVIKTKLENVGYHELKIIAYSEGNKDIQRVKLRFKSDISPELLSCKIHKTYKHDPKAYTQGLQYENGILYEGTGQYGQSSLRKVDLNTGDVKQYLTLEQKYFGEGITFFDDKIVQLTWNSRTGIIYDKETFKKLANFSYNTEGWGITHNGENLIMSVGTNKLHFLDTDVYSEIKAVEVFDDNGPITYLNELEYVDGLIYANVWQQKFIIVIDPSSGKVLQKIDCSNLVPEKYKFHNDNVLNGIAYNKENKHFYLTGKYWDILYEVTFE